MPGFKGNILEMVDVSDPKNPKEAGRWWATGQKEGEPQTGGGAMAGFHGPPVIDGHTAYMGYGSAVVILDISKTGHYTVDPRWASFAGYP